MVENTQHIHWKISEKELQKIKTLEFKGNQFGPFIHVGSVPFYLRLCPKGIVTENEFEIYLYCNASQHKVSKIRIEFTCNISEINFNENNSKTYKRFPSTCKTRKSPKWDELERLDCISIHFSFRINNIWDNNDNIIPKIEWNNYLNTLKVVKEFKWSLNINEINELKQYKLKQKLNSNPVYIGRIPFSINLYPKGSYVENEVSIYLNCEAQGLNISELYVWYQLRVNPIAFCDTYEHRFANFPCGYGLQKRNLKTDQILELDHLSIEVTAQILNIKDKDGNDIEFGEWNKYIGSGNGEQKYNEINFGNDYKSNDIINDIKNEIGILKAKYADDFKALQNENEILKQQYTDLKMDSNDAKIMELTHDITSLKQQINNMNNNGNNNNNMDAINELKIQTQSINDDISALKDEWKTQFTKIIQLESKCNELFKSMQNDDEILTFLKSINMHRYYNIFNEQGFESTNDLKYITKDTLKDMGINKIAHYSKILDGIQNYNNNDGQTNVL